MNAEEIRAEVEHIAAQAFVTMNAVYMGLKKNALNSDKSMDEWAITFSKQYAHDDKISEDFEFFTGLELRSAPAKPTDGGPPPRRNTLMWEALEKARKPQAPHIADVLHSLILDSSALGQSFESWCDEYGYDSDSRKAESSYRACQQNADKLRRIFNANDIAALETALQEY